MGESSGTAWLGQRQRKVQLQHQQNLYYPQQARPGGDQLNLSFPGMNPTAAAAVAALSQLTQFVGIMGSAERAMVELQGYGPMMGRGVPSQFMGPGPMHYGGPSAAVEKFELAGASPIDLAVMIKNHCSNGTALEGLGLNIDEIVQAWNEMCEAKKWQTGVPSFRLEPLLRRRASKFYHALEHS